LEEMMSRCPWSSRGRHGRRCIFQKRGREAQVHFLGWVGERGSELLLGIYVSVVRTLTSQ
jgi:hypothetical protein